jgi:hypothetical protein
MHNITRHNYEFTHLQQVNILWSGISRLMILLTAIGIASCTSNPDLTGTTSGTEAKIACGTIVQEDGSVAAYANVQLIPADYNPVSDPPLSDSSYGVTDADGKYELYTSDTGIYNVQSYFDDGSRLLIRDVHLLDGRTIVPVNTLRKPGTIRISLPDNADTVNGYLYLPGTDISVSLRGKSGSVTLDSVPAALFLKVCYMTENMQLPSVLKNDIIVLSGDTTVVGMPEWKYSAKLLLNTTSSGAHISRNVTNFPLLVRLNNDNFDFDQALSTGDDIRFTSKSNLPLSYEIELWDAVTGQAAIWVKADTIYGNDSIQSINMYWGNPTVVGKSNSPMLFDTSAGFQGVWHLSGNGDKQLDATANRYDGAIKGNQTRSSGVAGYGQHLNGSNSFTEMGNVCNPGSSDFTFCAWVKKTVSGKRQTIASKSTGGMASSTYGWLIELDPDGALLFFMAAGAGTWGDSGTFVLASNTWITDSAWHHVAVVADRSGENKSRMYIDGTDASTLPANGITTVGEVVNTAPLRLGADANDGNLWAGFLDECSISYRVRSQEWIRLSYFNQKIDSPLIVVRK